MRVAVLSSGGKDSAAAWWWAMCRGWEVTHLVTVRITSGDSWMFQVPGTHLVEYQAKLADVEWVEVQSEGKQEVEGRHLCRRPGMCGIPELPVRILKNVV